jgi:hypothetical protein
MSGHSIRLDSRLFMQVFVTRILVLLSILIWLGRWWTHTSLHHLHGAAFIDPKADNFYWILLYFNVPQAISGNFYLGLSIDIALVVLPILIFIYPFRRLPALIYAALTILYLVSYNSFATHHEHTLVGLVFVSFLLCFKEADRFRSVFNALRYYTCFLMASAALWKIGRGALWHPEQLPNILLIQHAEALIRYPQALFSQWIQFLIDSPLLSKLLWWGATLLELVFLVGFFTRRYDIYLFVAFWLFLFSDYFVMGLHFWELGILSIFFWPRFRRYFDGLRV